MSHAAGDYVTSPFVAEWVERLAPRASRALDVAMGRGRHAMLLAGAGLKTFGVDIRQDALADAVSAAAARGLRVHAWCADLTRHPLPAATFDLIVVTRYLQRDLFDAIANALAPNGAVLYETFTIDQRRHGTGPTSPHHLLERGELRERFGRLDVVFYEEVGEPEAVARIVARRLS